MAPLNKMAPPRDRTAPKENPEKAVPAQPTLSRRVAQLSLSYIWLLLRGILCHPTEDRSCRGERNMTGGASAPITGNGTARRRRLCPLSARTRLMFACVVLLIAIGLIRSCLRDLPVSVQHLRLGSVPFHRSDQCILNLFLYRPQPLLSACRAAFETFNFSFQFPDPISGSSQLEREPMRHSHRSLDVLFRDVSCIFKQANHGVPSLINRLKFGSWLLLQSKSNDFS
jgi:hypothetical protein